MSFHDTDIYRKTKSDEKRKEKEIAYCSSVRATERILIFLNDQGHFLFVEHGLGDLHSL